MNGAHGTSGVDWAQATKIGYSLLFSPADRLCVAPRCCCWHLKVLVKNQGSTKSPRATPAALWIRGLLILTCTGVSFAHGSNDGQKGMGLIMLILIGTVPTAYALNRAMPVDHMTQFVAVSQVAQESLVKSAPAAALADPRDDLTEFVRTKELQRRR